MAANDDKGPKASKKAGQNALDRLKRTGAYAPGFDALSKARGPKPEKGSMEDIKMSIAKGAMSGGWVGGALGGLKAVSKNKAVRKWGMALGAACMVAVVAAFVILGGGGSFGGGGSAEKPAPDRNASNMALKAGLTDSERILIQNAANNYNVPWELIASTYLNQKAATTTTCQPVDTGAADVDTMSSIDLAGQHVLVSMSPDSVAAAKSAVTAGHLGGVVLNGNWTTKDAISKAVKEIPSSGDIAPTVAADREGGQIQMNGSSGPSGMSNIPKPVDQAKMKPSDLQAKWKKWGAESKDAGITLTLGPVADHVPAGAKSGAIGTYGRQYGSDPKSAAPLVEAVVKGEADGGEATVAKHFPGLGLISGNTDFTGNKAEITDSVTDDSKLESFSKAIDAGSQIMVSSAYYTKLDPDNQAVFSHKIITDLLRGKLHFSGVVYSDALGSTVGAVKGMSQADQAAKFVSAGGDVILAQSPSDGTAMAKALAAKIDKDKDFKAKMQESTKRILSAKQGSSTAGGGANGDCAPDDGSDTSGGSGSSTPSDSLPDALKKIRYCESHGDYTVENPSPSSTASGAYQFLDTTWRSFPDAKGYARAKDAPASVQDKVVMALYAAQGVSPWEASRPCWGKMSKVPDYKLTHTEGAKGGSGKSAPEGGSDIGTSNGTLDRSKWNLTNAKGTVESISQARKSGNRWWLLMEVAKYAQSQGWQLGQNPLTGGVCTNSCHVEGSLHWYGLAFDLNHDSGESAAADKLMPILRSSTIGWIWKSPGHLDHVHIDVGAWYSYNPSNPGVANFQPDCAKGRVPSTTNHSISSYSPSNKVVYETAPACKNPPGDVGTSGVGDDDTASDGSAAADSEDYISPFQIPKKDVAAADQKTINSNLRASIEWIAKHLSANVKNGKNRDMTSGLVPETAKGDAENATYTIDDKNKAQKKAAEDVAATWKKALVELKLKDVDEAKAGSIYDTALAWVQGKPGEISGSDAAGSDGGDGVSSQIPEKYRAAFKGAAATCSFLKPNYLAAIAKIESNFGQDPNTHREHDGGVLGLMQQKPIAVADVLQHNQPTHYDQNGKPLSGKGDRDNDYDAIGMAAQILCNDWKLATSSHLPGDIVDNVIYGYNQGPGAMVAAHGHLSGPPAAPEGVKYVKRFHEVLAALDASTTSGGGSTGGKVTGASRSPLADKAAKLSLTKIGLNYTNARGANGLPVMANGTDCSGLIMWAYWEASGHRIMLPSSTATQINDNTKLSDVPMSGPHDLSNAKVGDLILFNGIAGEHAWGHVGMYIGGGKIMEERNPRTPAGISSLSDAYWQKLQWKVRMVTAK